MLHPLTLLLALARPAAALDHAPLQAVLTAHVAADGRVDYAAIARSEALDPYLEALAAAPLPADPGQRLALWINAYNALTIDLVADSWPLGSIMELDGGKVWDTRRYTVAGEQLTLNQLEHERIRPVADGRVHAAINCASLGCPPLSRAVYTAEGLQAQLDAAARAWAVGNAVVIDRQAGTARFNAIFDWFGEDFVVEGDAAPPGLSGELAEAAAWVAAYAPPDTAAWLRAGGYQASFGTYDWAINAR